MGGLGGREDAELLPADMGGGTRWEEWSRHELGGKGGKVRISSNTTEGLV